MALPNFTVGTINLTSYDEVTGLRNTANVYRVQGIDRELSAAQLVMALCLNRATEIEAQIVSLMEEMAGTTRLIEALSTFESKLVDLQDTGASGRKFSDIGYTAADTLPEGMTLSSDWANDWLWPGTDPSQYVVDMPKNFVESSTASIQALITNVETRLDSLNTNSQEKMIQLQSLTNKRDQTYDLITAMVKSMYTAENAIGANLR